MSEVLQVPVRERYIQLLDAFSSDLDSEGNDPLYREGAARGIYEAVPWVLGVQERFEGSDLQSIVLSSLPPERPKTKDDALKILAEIDFKLKDRARQVHILPSRDIKRNSVHYLRYNDQEGQHSVKFELLGKHKGMFFLPSTDDQTIEIFVDGNEKNSIQVGKPIPNTTGLAIIPESELNDPFEAFLYTMHELGHGEEERQPRSFTQTNGEVIENVVPYTEAYSTSIAIGAGLEWANKYGLQSLELLPLVYQISLYNKVLGIR